MKNRVDDYEGLVAQLYDFQYGAPGDVEFYVAEAKKAGASVLDLGCGTGRMLVPLLQAGLEATGLDLSADMLAQARQKIARLPEDAQKRARVVKGDMRRFQLDRTFDAVVIPFRSFMHLASPDDHRSALATIRDHLAPGGLLALNVVEPILETLVAGTSRLGAAYVKGSEFVNPLTFRRVIVSHTQRASLERQTLDEWLVFEEIDDDGKVVAKTYAPRTFRWFNRWELQYLLELSGFRVEGLFGDFARGPWKPGGEQVWLARRA